MYRSHLRFACALAWSAAALSCTTVSPSDPSSGDRSGDPSVEQRRQIAFAPCAEDPELQCGTLEVPSTTISPRDRS